MLFHTFSCFLLNIGFVGDVWWCFEALNTVHRGCWIRELGVEGKHHTYISTMHVCDGLHLSFSVQNRDLWHMACFSHLGSAQTIVNFFFRFPDYN